ncbi:unnamed protein product, partial [Mycena citricolor]
AASYTSKPPWRVLTTYSDQSIQVGETWAEELKKLPLEEPVSSKRRLDNILSHVKRGGWTLGSFLAYLFTYPDRKAGGRSARHAQMVSGFLRGAAFEGATADEVVELMYSSRDAAPREIRQSATPSKDKKRPDATNMARHRLSEWAITKVEGFVSTAAQDLSGKDSPFRRVSEEIDLDFIDNFSLATTIASLESGGAVILRLLAATALDNRTRRSTTYAEHFSRESEAGSGENRRDPYVIIVIVFLMLLYARNIRFSFLRKMFGIWLFANNASASIFAVLSRIGLSSSYTTILDTLRSLSRSTQKAIRIKAQQRAFLLIYDNINRMRRVIDPDLGQHDVMQSGAASMLIELVPCNVQTAFDPAPLREAREAGLRRRLTTDVLMNRLNMEELNALIALHCLTFLIAEAPVLHGHQAQINLRFRTSHAQHRMPDEHVTVMHPLATSSHNEGTTQGNRDVLDDLILRQLGMDKTEVDSLLVIVGGDQSTVEKIRTLQRFLDDCPHGYSRYGWVLPLIQLWHMGWADLERILSTHWGQTYTSAETGDMSSYYFINTILKRKIKNIKRPDYYPTQNFIFDTLRAEVIDCWKVLLRTDNLSAHFAVGSFNFEDLFRLSQQLTHTYFSVESSEKARFGWKEHSF